MMNTSVLRQGTASELLFDKKKDELIYVFADSKLDDVSMLLKKHNILSVPVYDKNVQNFIGLIDSVALMQQTADTYFQQMEGKFMQLSIDKNNPVASAQALDSASSGILLGDAGQWPKFQFGNMTAGDLVSSCVRCKSFHIFKDTELIEVIVKALALYQQHRVIITRNNNEFYMVSQMDILKWLMRQHNLTRHVPLNADTCREYQLALSVLNLMKETLQETVLEKGLVNPTGSPRVVAVDAETKAIDAFFMMKFHTVPAVAVVEPGFKLIGNLSASDLRGLSSQNISFLQLPVMEFVKKMTGKALARPVTCTEKETVFEVAGKMVGCGIHRVWYIDSAERPMGVITITDIIKALITKNKVQKK